MAEFRELVKGRWREFTREPSALFFVVFMPILWMTILGFAFSRPATEIYGVGWISDAHEAKSDTSVAVRTALAGSEHVRLVEGSQDVVSQALKRGDVQLLVTIVGGQVTYRFDPASHEATVARRVIDDVLQRAQGREDVLRVRNDTTRVPGTRYVDFLVPGLAALSIMTSSLFGTGMGIVANRREGLLKRYLATPMRPSAYIASHLVGRGFVLVIELGAILLAALLIFGFRVEGGIIAFTLFAALGASAFTAIALVCASRTANSAAMNGMTNLLTLPMMLVSGIWFSRASFPEWMATAAKALPLTALVDGLRKIALESASLADLGAEAAVLGGYTALGMLAARLAFKWY